MLFIMLNFILKLCLISFSVFPYSCVTQKRCLQKYPPQIVEVERVITEINTVTRDTTVYVHLPGNTIFLTDTLIVFKTDSISSKTSFLETPLAWSEAHIKFNKLFHVLHQKDTTLIFRLQGALKEIDRLEKIVSEKVTTVQVPAKLTWFQRMRLSMGSFLLISILIFLMGAFAYFIIKIKV
jgi:hypothetical protein